MTMEQRVSVITLGVAEVTRAQRFDEALGGHLDTGVDGEEDHNIAWTVHPDGTTTLRA
jgi:hypothetical protein